MPKATKRERQRLNRDARREAMLAEQKRRKRFKLIRNIGIGVLVLAAVLGLRELTRGDDSSDSSSASGAITCTDKTPAKRPAAPTFTAPPEMTIDPTATYTVTLDTSCGDVAITLDAAASPQTVNNFVFLAQQGFYDGTTFHRIVTDFVDQGGDPEGTGNGGPGYTLPDEPVQRAYKGGDVAMARGPEGISGSQFFLVVGDKGGENLGGPPGQYNLVGTMSKQGLKVAQKINTFGSSDTAGTPTRTIYVFSAKVKGPTTSSSTTTTAAP